MPDQAGGIPLVKRLVRSWPWIETVIVDGGYKATFIDAVKGMAWPDCPGGQAFGLRQTIRRSAQALESGAEHWCADHSASPQAAKLGS